jgi:glycosyltransferase involved in cell wall biosynthesis
VQVPYVTFPGAGRRGTTVLDRSTAYPLFGWRAGRRAAALVRLGRVDLVHGLGASVFGYAVARRREPDLTAPLVLNPQGLEEFGGTDPARAGMKLVVYRPLQAVVRACAAAADTVVATDTSLRPVVEAHLGVPASRVAIIPNAVDLERIDRLADVEAGRALRRRHHIGEEECLLLSAGRLEQNKGFDVLIDALARLGPAVPPWRWVLVGRGPWHHRLARAIEASGMASRIMMRGREDDGTLHAWYEAADVFVHPTLYEGSSLVTLEAMAHRTPIVATGAGGLPDKVRPGSNGWLVPPGDAGALAGAIGAVLASRAGLPAFGAASRAIVEGEFAWPAVAAVTRNLYETLLARASRGRR